MRDDWKNGGFGLYFHWPFCEAKCPYCDFNSHVVDQIDQERWKSAYLIEIERASEETEGRLLNSVFFGGGTPSLMQGDLVAAILDRIRDTWQTANDLEVTLEANPSSVEAGRFSEYSAAGVNRVSLGVQALNDDDLKRLGRLHNTEEALGALEIAKETFDRVSFDLIYARQDQSLSDWESELEAALELAADHLSLYQLTIEPGTAFGARHAKGGLLGLPSEDLSADMYELTQKLCDGVGMSAYEVSNHAKPNSESRHNKIYWEGGDYLGLGPGAHGRLTLAGQRYATETALAPMVWLKSVEDTGTGETNREALTQTDRVFEFVVMGLRLRTGIDKSRLSDPVFEHVMTQATKLQDQGLIADDPKRLRVTPTGMPLLNSIAKELLRDY